MNKKNKKGVLLMSVLVAAVLISIFLLTAVADLNNSFFLSKKFTSENKAYWAAETGIQYCEYKLKSDLGWPFFNATTTNNNETGTEKFGKFTVTTSKHDGGKGYYINGKSETDAEEFCIYFSKREDTILGSNDISIVPSSFPSEPKNLSYCSYSSMKKSDIDQIYLENIENKKIADTEKTFIVSNKPITYKTLITSPGIYIVSDGRSGPYRSVIETMLIANNGNGFNSGIYAGGNINLTLLGNESLFKCSNDSNGKSEIYCKGNINIDRKESDVSYSDASSSSNPLEKLIKKYTSSCPISLGDNGQIYFGQEIKIVDEIDENKTLSTKNMSTNDFKRTYGLNLEKYPSSKDDEFPKITWKDVENIRTKQEKKKDKDGSQMVEEIKSGSYVAILEETETDKHYTLCRLNKNYMKRDGQFSKKEFKEDLQKAKDNQAQQEKKITEENTVPIKNKKGKVVKTVLSEKGKQLLAHKQSDRGLIEEFIKNINGLSSDSEAKKDILASNKQDEQSNIFKIKTEDINDKLTPVITLKKSVKTKPNSDNEEYFNLFTLTKNNDDNEFNIDETTSTDLTFYDKNDGLSEKQLLLLSRKENANEYDDTTMLYTKGYVSINGKLSGTGQILSCGSIYFKAGSQLNTEKKYTHETHDSDGSSKTETITIPNSKLALYSKGTIQMGNPEGKGDLTELYRKIREVLGNKSASSYWSLTNDALNTEVEITDADKERVSKDFDDKKMLLKDCMTKYYGYTLTETRELLRNVVYKNARMTTYTDKFGIVYTSYSMPEEAKNIIIESQSPSSFNGIIYAYGGFKCDAEHNDVTINGVLVTYGSDPNFKPGSGENLDPAELLGIRTKGGIEIEHCNNFKVIYKSTDLNKFMKMCGQVMPVGLTRIYYNKL